MGQERPLVGGSAMDTGRSSASGWTNYFHVSMKRSRKGKGRGNERPVVAVYAAPRVPAAHWWLSGNVKLGLIWGSVVHCDVFVLVCCVFCMLGNVHLMFLEVLDTDLVKVQGGGVLFLATAQLTERPTEPSLSRLTERSLSAH